MATNSQQKKGCLWHTHTHSLSLSLRAWASTHQCTIQKIPFWDLMDGMKLSPRGQFTWSRDFFFFCSFFFPARFFSLAQSFFLATVLLSRFFRPPLTPSFFWEAPTYPPNLNPTSQPTYPLLPTNPPTSLILLAPSPPTSFCVHFHC